MGTSKADLTLRYEKWKSGTKGRGEPRHWLIAPWDHWKFEEDVTTIDITLDSVRNIAQLNIMAVDLRLTDKKVNGRKGIDYCWIENPDTQGLPRVRYHQTLHLCSTSPEDFHVIEDVSLHGTISYLRNGSIGKSYLVLRENKQEYLIDIACSIHGLYVKRVATTRGGYQKVYERQD